MSELLLETTLREFPYASYQLCGGCVSERKSKTWRFIDRAFLNDPGNDYHSHAYFIGRVENTEFPRAGAKTKPSIHFELSDCKESIQLYFNHVTSEDIQNSRYKVRAVRDCIVGFADALEAELDLREARLSRK